MYSDIFIRSWHHTHPAYETVLLGKLKILNVKVFGYNYCLYFWVRSISVLTWELTPDNMTTLSNPQAPIHCESLSRKDGILPWKWKVKEKVLSCNSTKKWHYYRDVLRDKRLSCAAYSRFRDSGNTLNIKTSW